MRSMLLPACELWQKQEELQTASPSEIVNRLDDAPLQSLFALYLAADNPNLRQNLRLHVSQWRDVAPQINGNDLRELGVPPGPVYRKILSRLRAAWLDGEISTLEGERAFLAELIANEYEH